MKKLLPFMTLAGIMTFAVAQSKEKIEKPIAEAIQSHLLEHGYLQPDRDHKDLDKVFKGAKLYRVWINSQMGDGVSSGSGLTILKQRDKISVFNQARNAVLSLIKSYDKKISNANELKAVMIAMTPVSEIKDMGDGVYHVYNGDDFFDVPSGFLVKLKDGKVEDVCRCHAWNEGLAGGTRKKAVSAAHRRDYARLAVSNRQCSQRKASSYFRLHRSTLRYRPTARNFLLA
ncbi:hypothetical protein OAG13_01890 [Akkermansiaceae bacterium]|nr:hypothetical protein [Akkermansiaceae bacterium]